MKTPQLREVATAELTPGELMRLRAMLDVAFDGRNYLVTWFEAVQEGNGWRSAIKAMRVAADGTPIDATPFTISELKAGFDEVLRDPGVAFDGQAYTVIWEDHKGYLIAGTRVYARRIGADGTLRGKKPVLLYPDKGGREPGGVDPEIGCANGRCLVAWTEFDGEVAPEGYYLDKGYGVMLEGGKPLATVATRIMNNAQVVRTIATDGTDFLVAAGTRLPCPATGAIRDAAVATRVTRAGTPLDLDPIRLDRSTADCPQTLTWGATFDGTNYVVPFTVLAPKPVGLRYGYYLFAARLAPDGTVLDDEMEGLLLHEQPFVLSANLTTTQLASVVTWTELTDANRNHVKARRVLPRASAPTYPAAVIGSIGTLAVPEGVDLLRTVHAPAGFHPAGTTLEASGLPPGAVFDPPTGAFRWRPDGTEAGVYPGVTFTATDGVQTASETVSVVVSEAVRSLSGIVRFGDGSRVTDAGIQISGIPREKPIAMTDRDGRWRITGLAPKTYVAKLDRVTRKRYRLLGPAVRTVVGTGDAVMPDVVVAPR